MTASNNRLAQTKARSHPRRAFAAQPERSPGDVESMAGKAKSME
jgi:hypothetical protein